MKISPDIREEIIQNPIIDKKIFGKPCSEIKPSIEHIEPNPDRSTLKGLNGRGTGVDLVHRKSIPDVIKTGDAVLKNAYSAETKPGKATFTLANGDEVFPNIWDPNGGNYSPNKGDIILDYGEAPKDWGIRNPNVLKQMEEKGLTTFPDRAVSAEPELMYKTYLGADGRDFTKAPLKAGETIAAEKKIFKSDFLFAKPGTIVETLESANASASRAVVGDFQFVQLDANGNPYVKDIKDLVKRLNPVGDESKGVFAQIEELIKQRDEVLKAPDIEDTLKTAKIHDIWEAALKKLIKSAKTIM